MTTVAEQVSEALLGSTEEPQLTQETRESFMKYALRDEKTGEHYMGEDEFINAVAPVGEDYVCFCALCKGQELTTFFTA